MELFGRIWFSESFIFYCTAHCVHFRHWPGTKNTSAISHTLFHGIFLFSGWLFQIHDVEFGDIEIILSETLPTLARLREENKIRYIGITGYPLSVLK